MTNRFMKAGAVGFVVGFGFVMMGHFTSGQYNYVEGFQSQPTASGAFPFAIIFGVMIAAIYAAIAGDRRR